MKDLRRLLIAWLLLWSVTGAVELELATQSNPSEQQAQSARGKVFFGQQLFEGNFKNTQQYRYNPDYLINVGDMINVKIWGAYEFVGDVTVDKQGNIFIPKVGVVSLLGVPNKKIKEKIKEALHKVFKKDVYVYEDVKQYQPISVFVSGAVKNVRLYSGLFTDSVLQFLDKAGGSCRGKGVTDISRFSATARWSNGSISISSSSAAGWISSSSASAT